MINFSNLIQIIPAGNRTSIDKVKPKAQLTNKTPVVIYKRTINTNKVTDQT